MDLSNTAIAEIERTFNSVTLTQLTVDEYVKRFSSSQDRWTGDSCGCPDDRCIGHHHADTDPCGCLDVLLDQLHDELCDQYKATSHKS